MHIPQHMLHGSICPVSLAVGAAGTAATLYCSFKTKEDVSPARFASVTALIFGMQMLNFPINHGTSGHLVGGVLAASFLGIPRAILSIVLVLITQALLFGDGGMDALGANILNMALIGAGLGGLMMEFLRNKGLSQSAAIALASIISITVASISCSFEVAAGGTVVFLTMAGAMVPIHLAIGVGEAVLSVALYYVLKNFMPVRGFNTFSLRTVLLMVSLAFMVPFASNLPDGLEHVARVLHIPSLETSSVLAFFNGYQVPGIHDSAISSMCAAILGMGIVYLLSFAVTRVEERL